MSRLGLTTKHMHAAMREERITQAAADWNRKKLLALPEVLSKQLNKSLDRHRKASLLLVNQLNDDLTESQLLAFTTNIQGSELGESDSSLEQKMSAESCLRQRVVAQLAKCKSAKQRPNVMKKLQQSTKNLKEYLASYLLGHQANEEQLLSALLNNDSHIFSWTQQQVLARCNFSRFLDVAETYQLVQRCKEEMSILGVAETYQLVQRCKEEMSILGNEASNYNKTIEEELSRFTPHSGKFMTFHDLKKRMALMLLECNLSSPRAPEDWESSDCDSGLENYSDCSSGSDSISSGSRD